MRYARSTSALLALLTTVGCEGPPPEEGDLPSTPEAVNEQTTAAAPADDIELSTQALKKDPIPDEIRAITNWAMDVSSAFSGFASGVAAAETFLGMVGVIKKADPALEFKKLHQKLEEMTEAGIFKNTAESQDSRIATLLGALTAGESLVSRGLRLQYGGFDDSASRNAAFEPSVNLEAAFLRLHRESVTDGLWKKVIADRPVVSNGLVWDWRQGLPGLMQLIAMRVQVMAAVENNFPMDGWMTGELYQHRAHLLGQLHKMRDGVRCGRSATYLPGGNDAVWRIDAVCADIHTGIERSDTYHYAEDVVCPPWGCQPRNPGAAFARADGQLDRLRREVLATMPIFQAQALADTMAFYARRAKDLGASNGTIPHYWSPGLCIDIQWGNQARGTPVWLWNCTGDRAQLWVYDRKSGQIRNRWANKCLDVQWGSRYPGAPVWTWDCTGNDAQRWTYDPVSKVLRNALGTVLNTQGNSLTARTPLVTADFDPNYGPGGLAQLWNAVP